MEEFTYDLKDRIWKCKNCKIPVMVIPKEGMICPKCNAGMIEMIKGEQKQPSNMPYVFVGKNVPVLKGDGK